MCTLQLVTNNWLRWVDWDTKRYIVHKAWAFHYFVLYYRLFKTKSTFFSSSNYWQFCFCLISQVNCHQTVQHRLPAKVPHFRGGIGCDSNLCAVLHQNCVPIFRKGMIMGISNQNYDQICLLFLPYLFICVKRWRHIYYDKHKHLLWTY